jgi:hypothetical protein
VIRCRRFAGPAIVVGASALMPLIVPPHGEFPINDDWVFALGVRELTERGNLVPPAYAASTAVLHILWGALFSQLLGFSQTTLRVSTLVLSGLGALGFYVLLREVVDSWRATIGALLLLLSPLYVPLAFSFQGDVPFLCLALWAQVCYVRAVRGSEPAARWLMVGSAFAAAAYLVRQLGLLLPVAVLCALCLRSDWRRLLSPGILLALLGPPLLAVLLGLALDSLRPSLKEQPLGWMLLYWRQQGPGLAGLVLRRYAELSVLLGLLTLPIWLAVLASRRPTARLRAGLVWSLVPIGLLLTGFVLRATVLRLPWWGPYSSNVISIWGYFPFSNQGVLPPPLMTSRPLLMLLSAASLLAACALIVATVRVLRGAKGDPGVAVPVLSGALVLGVTLVYHQFFDRYGLAVLPSAILAALTALPESGRARWLASAGLILLAGWSLAWERDLLARRAALWGAGLELVEQGVQAEAIDGGYEWNGWHAGPELFAEARRMENDGTGEALHAMVLQRLYFRPAAYSLVFEQSSLPPGAQVVLSVPYGGSPFSPSNSVLAVYRAALAAP